MRALVVYYSRTGHTKNLAQLIARSLGAELEEITERSGRLGIRGYLRSGREAFFGRRADLVASQVDLAAYDLVVIGTPVWNVSLSSPVRTFLADHAKELRSVAFFCTLGGSGSNRVFRQMQDVCGKPPVATFARTERELESNRLSTAVDAFVAHLRTPPVAQAGQPVHAPGP